ncbi:MAG: hypothetical protein K5641_08235 [Lachnospiraceae bacterium]|nr:hypothetical protein [Lachnospiraceae bacterium]
MRINSDTLGMESARSYTSTTRKELKHQSFFLSGDMLAGEDATTLADEEKGKEATETEEAENSAVLAYQQQVARMSGTKMTSRTLQSAMDQIRQECLAFILKLFGADSKNAEETAGDTVASEICLEDGTPTGLMKLTPVSSMMSVDKLDIWQFTSEYTEVEETSFSTSGTVVTADGREISFNLEMKMSRTFMQKTSWTYEKLAKNVSLCDPLVINLDDNIASVSDQKFLFDLNADGTEEEISTLGASSGFLALDLDGNGKIDDGTELFGAKSGDGFRDLAAYDSDHNGWIDENDDIWSKLLIWVKDESGEDVLYHLADKGVGAIGLRSADTEFTMQSHEDFRTNAVIRKTGMFLYENGMVGSLQHVDLAMEA